MDLNVYLAEILAQSHLAELRAQAQQCHQAQQTGRRRPLRVALGHALIRAGHRLLGGLAAVEAPA
jgi:HPt (histidine-containing phosphotransfer) domain-containing protein